MSVRTRTFDELGIWTIASSYAIEILIVRIALFSHTLPHDEFGGPKSMWWR